MLPKRLGRYELIEEIARGAYGIVHRAVDLELGRVVAVKQMRGDESSPEAVARFFREARTAARLTHPHIVRVFDLGEAEGRPFFAMELVDGVPLTSRIYFDAPDAAAIALTLGKVARAVDFAHGHGVVHRDLKPGNILIRPDGEPAITDFGVARDLTRRTALTQAGELLGTPCYMAPEQLTGRPVDARIDVYSLGVILYEFLAHRTPFTASGFAELSMKVLNDPPEPPSRTNPMVDPRLERICLKCLEKDPDLRYATAGELADDLARAAQGLTLCKAMPRRRRSRWFPAWIGVTGALVLGALSAAGPPAAVPGRRIDSDPPGASIFAGGRFIGIAPVWTDAGWVEARLPGRPSLFCRDARAALPAREQPGMAAIGRLWVDDHEVTNAEYARFVEESGIRDLSRALAKSRMKEPVTGVTWEEATAYAAWAGKRLPTADEWREAASSGVLVMAGGNQEWVSDAKEDFRALCGGSDWMPPAERDAATVEWRPRLARFSDAGFRCVKESARALREWRRAA